MEYFLRREVGIYRVDLDYWCEFFTKAKDLKKHQSGGNNTNVCVEDGIVYVNFLGGGEPDLMPLEDSIVILESRLPGLEHELS